MTDVTGDARYLTCPRCRLSIEPKPQWLTIRYCPRCLGRSRTLVELFRSTVPAHVLYSDHPAPRSQTSAIDNVRTRQRR
jgi:Zn-finger nucleic acid-binding protein